MFTLYDVGIDQSKYEDNHGEMVNAHIQTITIGLVVVVPSMADVFTLDGDASSSSPAVAYGFRK